MGTHLPVDVVSGRPQGLFIVLCHHALMVAPFVQPQETLARGPRSGTRQITKTGQNNRIDRTKQQYIQRCATGRHTAPSKSCPGTEQVDFFHSFTATNVEGSNTDYKSPLLALAKLDHTGISKSYMRDPCVIVSLIHSCA